MPHPAALIPACLACALLPAGPAAAAVERKVLRVSLRTAEAGFDPQRVSEGKVPTGACDR